MPTIKNLQKKIPLPISKINKILKKINKILDLKSDYCIVIVAKENIRRINKKYLNINSYTDVISFGSEEKSYLGDIFVCAEIAKSNAVLYKTSFLKELILYITHGILHLIDFDDIKLRDRLLMREKENQVLKSIFKET
jgi:probable rRNA maturation factor